MVDLLCEETVHEQESFRTRTVKGARADTASTAEGRMSLQGVHSSLPLFHKVLYRREKRTCLYLKSSLSIIEGGGKNELSKGDLKFSAVLSWCLISNNKEISNILCQENIIAYLWHSFKIFREITFTLLKCTVQRFLAYTQSLPAIATNQNWSLLWCSVS